MVPNLIFSSFFVCFFFIRSLFLALLGRSSPKSISISSIIFSRCHFLELKFIQGWNLLLPRPGEPVGHHENPLGTWRPPVGNRVIRAYSWRKGAASNLILVPNESKIHVAFPPLILHELRRNYTNQLVNLGTATVGSSGRHVLQIYVPGNGRIHKISQFWRMCFFLLHCIVSS